MEQHTIPPQWLETIGWISLGLAFLCSFYILYDIYIRGYRQKMGIMEAVYPVTALYFGPIAVWFYAKYGRKKSKKLMEESAGDNHKEGNFKWHQISEADTHCGAGCTLGDIIGEWLVFVLAITIAGKALFADYVFDFIFAWSLGIIFQYFTIVPMRGLGKLQGIKEAIKADTLSIIAFQFSLFAGMFVYQELLFANPLPKTSASYWFLMQLSMILGFFTSYPVNKWLLRKGVKEAM